MALVTVSQTCILSAPRSCIRRSLSEFLKIGLNANQERSVILRNPDASPNKSLYVLLSTCLWSQSLIPDIELLNQTSQGYVGSIVKIDPCWYPL